VVSRSQPRAWIRDARRRVASTPVCRSRSSLNELWRVGYHTDPLSVSIEYQGDGRFDDPQRERTVLYGSDAVETCIIEIAMPWYLHSDASYVERMEAPERESILN
jgi:hypothetical protein